MSPWRFTIGAAALLTFGSVGCGSSAEEDTPVRDAGLDREVGADALPPDAPLDTVADDVDDPDVADTVDPIVQLTVFHTSDEHGWLLPDDVSDPTQSQGGAANVLAWLREREGYAAGDDLLLSSGDNWSGPAISSWFRGEPMVEAFNLMGYDAVAIGNHEFDFGFDVLRQRGNEASFPYLGANISFKSGDPVDFAIPTTTVNVRGVNVGIVGLTTISTSTDAHPKIVQDLVFAGYVDTLSVEVPKLRAEGADVVIVLAHECAGYLEQVAAVLPSPVDAMFAGHCHAQDLTEFAGVAIVSSGYNWHGFSRVDLTFDRELGRITDREARFVHVSYDAGQANPVTPDPALQSLADGWKQKVDSALGENVGYTQDGITQGSWAMANWITDAWLWAYPQADVAIQNFGGMRQSIPQGVFAVSDVVGMLPFENDLVIVELTGAALTSILTSVVTSCGVLGGCHPSVGGMTYKVSGGLVQITLTGGTSVDPAATYRIITSDFLYWGGDGYELQANALSATEMGTNLRDSVIDWTQGLDTSPTNPLEASLDPAPRDL